MYPRSRIVAAVALPGGRVAVTMRNGRGEEHTYNVRDDGSFVDWTASSETPDD